jgi:hypothetical protein
VCVSSPASQSYRKKIKVRPSTTSRSFLILAQNVYRLWAERAPKCVWVSRQISSPIYPSARCSPSLSLCAFAFVWHMYGVYREELTMSNDTENILYVLPCSKMPFFFLVLRFTISRPIDSYSPRQLLLYNIERENVKMEKPAAIDSSTYLYKIPYFFSFFFFSYIASPSNKISDGITDGE